MRVNMCQSKDGVMSFLNIELSQYGACLSSSYILLFCIVYLPLQYVVSSRKNQYLFFFLLYTKVY